MLRFFQFNFLKEKIILAKYFKLFNFSSTISISETTVSNNCFLFLLLPLRMSCSVDGLPAGCRLRGMGSTVQSGPLNSSLSGAPDTASNVVPLQRPPSQKPCCFCWCCCCSCSWYVSFSQTRQFRKNCTFVTPRFLREFGRSVLSCRWLMSFEA